MQLQAKGTWLAKLNKKATQPCWLVSAGVLLELVQQRGFEIFVHPIPPVLNETRHVVMPFNQQLKQRVSLLTVTSSSQFSAGLLYNSAPLTCVYTLQPVCEYLPMGPLYCQQIPVAGML